MITSLTVILHLVTTLEIQILTQCRALKCNMGLQQLKFVSYAAVKAVCCTLINMFSQSTVSNFAPESLFHSRWVGLVSPKT